MDFASRDLYRRAIEQLARGSKQTELAIARAALSAGSTPCANDSTGIADRRRDPGYHLIGAGRRAFEAAVGYRISRWSSLGRFGTREAGDYIAAIVLIAGIVLCLPMIVLHSWGVSGSRLALLALLGMVPSIDAAIALVNRAVTRGLGATILPGLALREGIPSHLRTMIVVPALLTTRAAIEEHIERLEIHYLASPEVELFFALLSDWTDAPTEHTAGDAPLLDIAAEGIARLNRLHGAAPAGERFVLLHRRRVWSSGQ
jgi:cyclic beta-1,2-glucan synthetase